MMNATQVFDAFGAFIQNNLFKSTTRGLPGGAIGETEDGTRNLWTIFKYSKNPTFQRFYEKYSRQNIAHTVVEYLPKRCWRDVPEIKGRDKDLQTLKAIGAFSALEKADILNRIGSFSVLYIGIPDGLEPKEPLGTASANAMDEVYFTPYPEDGVVVNDLITDPADARYGLPEFYELTVQKRSGQDKAATTGTIRAHWSRVVHLAEGALSSKVEGLSALSPILNDLDDLEKTSGGSAEGFFRVGQGAWTFKVDPEFAAGMKDDEETKLKVKNDAAAFTNGWQRFLMLFGMEAKPVDVKVPDGSKGAMISIKLISGATGLSLRILIGEASGQVTGREDKDSMNSMTLDRQESECSGWLRDTWGIFANAGMLKELTLDTLIDWQPFSATTEMDAADIMLKKAQAIGQVSAALGDMGGITGEVDKAEIIREVLGLTPRKETDGDD